MKTIKKKTFDTVKMMREIRDKISSETENMTFEELKKYIAKTKMYITEIERLVNKNAGIFK